MITPGAVTLRFGCHVLGMRSDMLFWLVLVMELLSCDAFTISAASRRSPALVSAACSDTLLPWERASRSTTCTITVKDDRSIAVATEDDCSSADATEDDRASYSILLALRCVSAVLRVWPLMALCAAVVGSFSRLVLPAALRWYLAIEVSVWLSVAASSSVFFRHRQHRATRAASGLTPQLETFRRCIADENVAAEEFLVGWFVRATTEPAPAVRLDELRRGNVEEFIAWAQHSALPRALRPTEREQVDESLRRLEARLSSADVPFAFPLGHNEKLHTMRHNLDPPARHILHRPLLYYLLTDVLFQRVLTPFYLRRLGFKPHRVTSRRHRHTRGAPLRYWYHPGLAQCSRARSDGATGAVPSAAASAARAPIVFVHGVGFGLLPYTGWARKLLHAARGAPVMLLCLPFGAQQLGAELGWRRTPAHAEQATWEVALALRKHGHREATFVGHSLGTTVLTWLCRLRPRLVASSVFIDPICFLLHHASVSRGFLYSRYVPPPTSERARLEKQVENYFITSEAGMLHHLHKHFHWFANNLFADELTAPAAVILAEDDQFVPVGHVRASLERAMAPDGAAASGGTAGAAGGGGPRHLRRVQSFPVGHGQFMYDGAARLAALKAVRDAHEWGAA